MSDFSLEKKKLSSRSAGNFRNKSFEIIDRRVFLWAFFLISLTLAYFPVFKSLVVTWYTSEDYSHGFFIVPVCVYILWRKRDELKKAERSESNWGLIPAALSLILYVLAFHAEIATLSSLSMVTFVAGAVAYVYGFRLLREAAFPLFLLLFMIPVPAQVYSSLTIPLQLFVSQVSVWIGAFFGLPIYREGNVIHLPERTLQVVQACSGLRSMISLLTLSAVFGFLAFRSNTLRTVLFLSGVPVAVFVNVIRVVLLVFASQYFAYDLTEGTAHTVFGLFLFLLALVCIALIRGVLCIWDKPAKKELPSLASSLS